MATSMPLMIEGKFWPQVYQKSFRALSSLGLPSAPRGKRTVELQPCCTVTEDLSQPCLFIADRWLNYAFGFREAFWILDGDASLASIGQYNSRIKQFSDDGVTMHGAYGPRIFGGVYGKGGSQLWRDQFNTCAVRLKKDRDTRQAVINIWDNGLDHGDTKDYPCNTQLMFKIRDGRLNMTVIRRSSDIIWGLPYDHLCFTLVLLAMAGEVGVAPGRLVEFADSLHYYTDLYEAELKATRLSTEQRAVGFDVNASGFSVERFREQLRPLIDCEHNVVGKSVVSQGHDHLQDELPPIVRLGLELCYAYLAVKRMEYKSVHTLLRSPSALPLGAHALIPLLRKRAATEEQNHGIDSDRVNLQRALSIVL